MSGEESEESGMDFQTAMERLREIADHLDSGELPLEEAMEVYQEGLELIQFCEERLEEAEMLIQEVDDSDPSQPQFQPKEPPDA